MDKRPQIGITGNHKLWSPGWWCSALAIKLAGADPVRISIARKNTDKKLSALIIGGGSDISPEHYNMDIKNKVKLDIKRDLLEINEIRKALDLKIPILGICRGAQLINVVLGGSLYQDIRKMRKNTKNNPGLLPTKKALLKKGSLISYICKKRSLRINSLHHQAIEKTGKNLKPCAFDLDNIIQSVEDEKRKILGVQWHPEYLIYLPSQFRIFKWLVKNTQK